MEIISREYNGIEVMFDNSQSLYINATQIAKHFNKLPKDWLKTKETKVYLEAISRKENNPNGELVVIHKGGNPKEQGTWIHKKLIIFFARWLSPNFAVWCDQQIEEILKSKSSQSSQPKENIDLDEILVISKKMLELASMFGLSRESRYISADRGVKRVTGNSPLELLGISQKVSFKDMPII